MSRPAVNPEEITVHLNVRVSHTTYGQLVALAKKLGLEHAGKPNVGGAARTALERYLRSA